MTLRSEVVGLLDSVTSLGGRNYADEAPDAEQLPYTVTRDWIGESIALLGDSRTQALRRMLQVDLWQEAALDDGSVPAAVVSALDGQALLAGLRLRVQGSQRTFESDTKLAHHSLTLEVVRLR